MDRKQFTFYESFARALSRIRKKADRADAYDAIVNYALYGTEPDMDALSDAAAIAFDLIRPNLDTSRRKADNGQAGGKSKQTASNKEANGRQWEAGTEKENEIEKEIENECSPLYSPAAAEVVSDYLNRINAAASPASLDELRGFAEEIGPDVCRRAFDIALDAKKATWPYIRAILRDKHSRGVRCLADWDALEQQPARHTGAAAKVPYGSAGTAELGEEEQEAVCRLLGGADDGH